MALVPPTQEMARSWREQVFLDCRWTVCPNQSGVLGYVAEGEAGGRFVVADRWPERRAYMKPRRRDPDPRRARAAREKICADLAHDVGCRVPPVVLSRREGEPFDEERACCVSLVMYPRQYPWEQIKRFLQAGPPGTEILRERLPVAAAEGFAFDTWVGQTDHADHHPHNIVFGYVLGTDPKLPPLEAEYVFLDFAMALGWGGLWEGDGARTMGAAPFPPGMIDAIDMIALGGMLDRIESITDATIADIVNRIPDDYLSAAQREVITSGLRTRRALVRGLVASAAGRRS
ncbi:MAG TPA: hypothetical protein VHT91_19550 [Kofleriaceae bacterium]|jgi:hypothetical protein|nr:hypothetical protein [Kofleriaceae bacterium]